MFYHGVKTELDVVSYQYIIGNIKTQQEAAVKPRVLVDVTCRGDIFGFIYKILCSTSFEIIILLAAVPSCDNCFVLC